MFSSERYAAKFIAWLTGIPQFVEIPAPVTTTIFLAAANVLAIFCSCRSSCFPTSRTVIVAVFQGVAEQLGLFEEKLGVARVTRGKTRL